MRALLAAVACVLALALAPAALAAEPRASLPDIEDEVMCLQCGTALNVSTAAVAERQREFIRRRIRQGRTKEQIKQALVAEFGPAVLAVPEDDGFSIAAWLVPALLVAGGIVGVAVTARRWRGAGAAGTIPAPPLTADDERRLDADLAAFDR